MSTRKITFPDHTADDFDPDQVFEASNDLKYTWNGYGWELVDGGIAGYDDTALWEDQRRQDNEYVKGQAEQDEALDQLHQEFIKGQAEQDEALEQFKEQVAEDQARQDEEIAELKAGCQPSVHKVVDTFPGKDEIHFNSGDLINLGMDFDGVYSEGDAFVIESTSCTIYQVIGEQEWNGEKYTSIKASVPEEIKALDEVTIDLCDKSDYVTRLEFDTDQKRQDDANKALDALIEAEILLLADSFAKGQAAQDDAFAKGQAAQDDAFAKGQATQDKALQDEIDARAERDLQHDAQISTIEYKLDALLGLQFRGAYRFKHDVDCDAALLECYTNAAGDINAQQQCNKDMVACEQGKVTQGTFEAVDPDDRFDHLLSIVVHETDLSGIETEWGNVLDAGDYVEIDHQIGGVADKTNYGLYRITEEPEITQNAAGENVYSFQLEFLQGDGEMLVDEIYEIRGINKDEGVNPEELADFLTREDAMKTYLPLIGGTLSGTLNGQLIKSTRATGYAFEAKPDDATTTAWINTNGSASFTSFVKVDGNNLATEEYVDANMSAGAKGEKGNLGAGEAGPKGNRGATGGSGAKGNRGSNGSNGAKGARGNDMVMSTGTSTNPSLSRGKMYLNTTYNVLYIGT